MNKNLFLIVCCFFSFSCNNRANDKSACNSSRKNLVDLGEWGKYDISDFTILGSGKIRQKILRKTYIGQC